MLAEVFEVGEVLLAGVFVADAVVVVHPDAGSGEGEDFTIKRYPVLRDQFFFFRTNNFLADWTISKVNRRSEREQRPSLLGLC